METACGAAGGAGLNSVPRYCTASAATKTAATIAEPPRLKDTCPPAAPGATAWPDEKDALPAENLAMAPTWLEVAVVVAPPFTDWLPYVAT